MIRDLLCTASFFYSFTLSKCHLSLPATYAFLSISISTRRLTLNQGKYRSQPVYLAALINTYRKLQTQRLLLVLFCDAPCLHSNHAINKIAIALALLYCIYCFTIKIVKQQCMANSLFIKEIKKENAFLHKIH